ncbi:hypothetical protein RugamoR64_48120 [Duganella rhizosphaerae]|uniref:hypothetical protein n=1 Tax=Duganella rhizosphaerae TaxID=2885763 RepID=UPI0030E8AE1D
MGTTRVRNSFTFLEGARAIRYAEAVRQVPAGARWRALHWGALKQYKSRAEVKKAVADKLNAIGSIEKPAVDDTVKVVASVP